MVDHIKIPLLIVSFHRSGSSLSANLFHSAGMHLGDKLLGAKPSNPYGHFEDTDIISFHDALLGEFGHAWFQDRGPLAMMDLKMLNWIKNYTLKKSMQHKAFGVKDPRLCLTIRHWQAALGRVNVVFIHRNARSCISSLWNRALRDYQAGTARKFNETLVNEPNLVARIYAHNVSSFLSWYAAQPAGSANVIFASYDDIVSQRRNIVEESRRKWGYDLGDVHVRDFYDESAVTSSSDWSVNLEPGNLSSHVDVIDRQLMELCAT